MDIDHEPSSSLITPQSERTTRLRKRKRSPSPRKEPIDPPARLQPHELLLELPNILAHPPGHKLFVASCVASLAALRACAELESVAPDVECRAWTGYAEVAVRVVCSGWAADERFPWANRLEDEVCRLSAFPSVAERSCSCRLKRQSVAPSSSYSNAHTYLPTNSSLRSYTLVSPTSNKIQNSPARSSSESPHPSLLLLRTLPQASSASPTPSPPRSRPRGWSTMRISQASRAHSICRRRTWRTLYRACKSCSGRQRRAAMRAWCCTRGF